MTGRVTTYDIRQVVVTFGPIPIQGFAEGDALTSERDNPQESATAGADGDVVRVINASGLATVTLRLARGSVSSALLRQWRAASLPPLDVAPFIIQDLAALLVYSSAQAWLPEDPLPSFSADAPVDEWKVRLANLKTTPLLPPTG